MAIDPDVKVLLDALEARIAALETNSHRPVNVHPVRVTEDYEDGSQLVYEPV